MASMPSTSMSPPRPALPPRCAAAPRRVRPVRVAARAESGTATMSVTAETVRQLRERTGAGMMECKKALVETRGDLDSAAELMRRQGLAKADKKAARVAAEGVIALDSAADGRSAAMVEINCETDFVARNEHFQEFAAAVAHSARTGAAADLDSLLAARLASGETID